jgi:NAD+ kinase
MGINLGTLGFLAAYGAGQLDEALDAAIGGSLYWTPRLRLHVVVERRAGTWECTGSNDVYVKHGALPRMIDLSTTVAGVPMARYRADGLLVCTPMGSTAYNLAAGGPIVNAGTEAFTITPICPHSLTHRPVVTSAFEPIGIVYSGPTGSEAATLSVDGLWSSTLEVGDEVTVTKAPRPLKLVPPSASVFEVLRRKLGWSHEA